MNDSYHAEIKEGILNRTKARFSGAKAGIAQPFKNMYKVGGSIFKGTGPKGISLTGMDEASIEAKIKSIAKSSAKDLLNDWYKLGLIPNLRDEDIETLKNAFIETLTTKSKLYEELENQEQGQAQQGQAQQGQAQQGQAQQGQAQQGQKNQKQQYSDKEVLEAKNQKAALEKTLKELAENLLKKLKKIAASDKEANLTGSNGVLSYWLSYKNEKGETPILQEVQKHFALVNQAINNTLKNKKYSPAFWNLVSQRNGLIYYPSVEKHGDSVRPGLVRTCRFDLRKKQWIHGSLSRSASDEFNAGSSESFEENQKQQQKYWQKEISKIPDLESLKEFLLKMVNSAKKDKNIKIPDIYTPIQFKNKFFNEIEKDAILYLYAKDGQFFIKRKKENKNADREWDQEKNEEIDKLIHSIGQKLDEYIVQNQDKKVTFKDIEEVLEKLPNIEDIKRVANNLNNQIYFNNQQAGIYWNEEDKKWVITDGIEPSEDDFIENENEQNAPSAGTPAKKSKTKTPAKPKTPEEYAKIGSRVLSDRNNIRKLEGMEDLSSKMLKYVSSRKPLKKKKGVTTMVNYADKIGSDIDSLLKKFGVKA